MPTSPFDPTVEEMAAVAALARADGDRAGYFAAMYGAVTRRVRTLALAGEFDDPERMAAFVDAFAGRYLDAVRARRSGGQMTQAWSAAFAVDASWRPTILQHLLLGMTAHIGLDLGIVAAQVASMPGSGGLARLRPDFDGINDVLAAMVPEVEAAVGDLSPALGLLDRLGGRADAFAVTRVIARARDLAWGTATRLVGVAGDDRAAAIVGVDREVAEWSRVIAHPGPIASSVLLSVRVLERHSVATVIDRLGELASDA